MRAAAIATSCTWVVSLASAEPPACKPGTGRPLLEIAQGAPPHVKVATAITRLYESGAWTAVVTDREGRTARTRTGCLDPARLDGVRADLTHAAWRVVHLASAIPCRADARFTQYTWRGKLVFTERACDGDELDHDSRDTLVVIARLLHVSDELDGARSRCADNPLAPGCP